MATLTLRMEDDTRDELELLARGRGTTVSALLRGAIDGLLGRTAVAASTSAPKSLSMLDRQMLVLQHEILKRLAETADALGEAEQHEQHIKVLQQGFTTEYHREFIGIHEELTPAEGALTMEILDMFTVVEAALGRLDDTGLAELGEGAEHTLRFAGFDHNDAQEVRLAGLAEHLVASGRWSGLAYHFDDEHEGGNSHMPVLTRYQRMLLGYEAVVTERKAREGAGAFSIYHFDVSDLQKILEATQRPGTMRHSREW
ncbi:YfbU family protein [Amycolatopsis sp. NPDC004625]|uniref:YfbU family protein n=1 Tax=Amycolatopsis sp. NPDC004625 TaxID=3154670 RepID=UPI0033A87768